MNRWISVFFASLLFVRFFVPALVSGNADTILFIFSDVDPLHPHYSAIEYLNRNDVIQGYEDGNFRPENEINRAEALKILFESSSNGAAESVFYSSFSDYSPSEWYARYVEKARELGIVQGYLDGTFRPGNTVNLVEMLKMLIESNSVDDADLYTLPLKESPFSDVQVDVWFSKYVQYAKDARLIESDEQNRIFPDKPMTRAQFSEIVYRFMIMKDYALEYFNADVVFDSTVMDFEDDINDFLEYIESEREESIVDYEEYFTLLGL